MTINPGKTPEQYAEMLCNLFTSPYALERSQAALVELFNAVRQHPAEIPASYWAETAKSILRHGMGK